MPVFCWNFLEMQTQTNMIRQLKGERGSEKVSWRDGGFRCGEQKKTTDQRETRTTSIQIHVFQLVIEEYFMSEFNSPNKLKENSLPVRESVSHGVAVPKTKEKNEPLSKKLLKSTYGSLFYVAC